jgi:hypothetical protein
MMVLDIAMVVMLALPAAVSSTFWLKGCPHPRQLRAQALEHALNHMVGAYAQQRLPDFSRQVTIPQMPGKSHQLKWLPMLDLEDRLRSRADRQPSPVVELQPIAIRHRDCRW